LRAVREQLALLGHDVPDHVISGFLAEFGAAPADNEPVAPVHITAGASSGNPLNPTSYFVNIFKTWAISWGRWSRCWIIIRQLV
jgi:hypothetical protein